MNLPLLLALAAQKQTSVMDALPHLAGMIMVMVTLTILWWVCALNAKLIQILSPSPKARSVEAPAAREPAADPEEDGLETIAPEIIAVIAAAVAVSTGAKCRIISIKPQSSSWERAGRQSVLSSHRIR